MALVLGAWLALFVWGFFPASSAALSPREVAILSGDRLAAAEALAAAGLLDSPRLMAAYLSFVTPTVNLAPRAHWLGGGRTPRQLAWALGERGGAAKRIALPEGWTSFDLARRLEDAGICQADAFLSAARDKKVLLELGLEAPSAEGYLFPESHELRLDERPERVVRKFVREGQRRWAALAQEYPLTEEHRALGFTFHEVIVLASIVERETANPAERPKIARVFLNRLLAPRGETGGRLESDPTAVYGCWALGVEAPPTCAGAPAQVSPSLIKDERNPYGTYRRSGLPPGPIGNPGEAAIVAVLRPAPGDELYFVADGQGNHHFSRTFAEHRQFVERLKALRRRPGQ